VKIEQRTWPYEINIRFVRLVTEKDGATVVRQAIEFERGAHLTYLEGFVDADDGDRLLGALREGKSRWLAFAADPKDRELLDEALGEVVVAALEQATWERAKREAEHFELTSALAEASRLTGENVDKVNTIRHLRIAQAEQADVLDAMRQDMHAVKHNQDRLESQLAAAAVVLEANGIEMPGDDEDAARNMPAEAEPDAEDLTWKVGGEDAGTAVADQGAGDAGDQGDTRPAG
jgi:hypothetical protein